MNENEIAIGTALVPADQLHGYWLWTRLARQMMEGWLKQYGHRMTVHEWLLLRRQIVNMGEIAAFFEGIEAQHREWIGNLTGADR